MSQKLLDAAKKLCDVLPKNSLSYFAKQELEELRQAVAEEESKKNEPVKETSESWVRNQLSPVINVFEMMDHYPGSREERGRLDLELQKLLDEELHKATESLERIKMRLPLFLDYTVDRTLNPNNEDLSFPNTEKINHIIDDGVEPYIFLETGVKNWWGWKPWLRIGVQTFFFQPCDSEQHALWHRKMVQKGIENLVTSILNKSQVESNEGAGK